jgi:hypothetical protein
MKFFERIERHLYVREKFNQLNELFSFEDFFISSSKKEIQRKWTKRQDLEQRVGTIICEREIYLKEEIESFEKKLKIQSLSPVDMRNLRDFRKELRDLDLEWWLHTRDNVRGLTEEPKGSIVLRYKLFKDAQSELLVLECQLRGGCCAYSCGCCHTPRECSRGPLLGHCSLDYCGCCTRRRGYEEIPDPRLNTFHVLS